MCVCVCVCVCVYVNKEKTMQYKERQPERVDANIIKIMPTEAE